MSINIIVSSVSSFNIFSNFFLLKSFSSLFDLILEVISLENKEEIVNEDIDETKLYFKKKNEEIIHNHLDEETTSYQIKRKNLEFNSSQDQDENKEQNNDQNVCNLEKIKEILNKNVGSDTYIEITKNISNDDKHTKNAIDNLLKKKRPRKSDEEFEILKNEYNKKKTINKRGRQIKNKRYTGCHNKYSGDNMIKKTKGYLFDYCLTFMNNILYKYKEGNRGALLKLDYKIKDSINQKKDLNILNMPLKDLFSINEQHSCCNRLLIKIELFK